MKRDWLTRRLESAKNWIREQTGLSIRTLAISVAVILLLGGIYYLWSLLAPHLNTLEGVKTLISFISTLATAIAGILVLWNIQIARRNARQGEEKLITERFSKAVEQLGSDKMEIRLGGIYSLERIAKDSPKDHWTIMEVLTAFIREKCPLEKDEKPLRQTYVESFISESHPSSSSEKVPKIATDVQAALTVIGRRIVEQDPKDKTLNLRFTNLSRADLSKANFSKANFSGANLSRAWLSGANLGEAYFGEANLSRAYLGETNLSGVEFFRADLSGAYLNGTSLIRVNLNGAILSRANLSEANFYKANLSKATFYKTNLSKANLNGTDLFEAILNEAVFKGVYIKNTENLTLEQVKLAENWEQANYDPDFRQQLGLPPE